MSCATRRPPPSPSPTSSTPSGSGWRWRRWQRHRGAGDLGHGVVVGESETQEFYLLPHGADMSPRRRGLAGAASRVPSWRARSPRSPWSAGRCCCSRPAARARPPTTAAPAARQPPWPARSPAGTSPCSPRRAPRGLARGPGLAERRLHRGGPRGTRPRRRRQRHDQRRGADWLSRRPRPGRDRRPPEAERRDPLLGRALRQQDLKNLPSTRRTRGKLRGKAIDGEAEKSVKSIV